MKCISMESIRLYVESKRREFPKHVFGLAVYLIWVLVTMFNILERAPVWWFIVSYTINIALSVYILRLKSNWDNKESAKYMCFGLMCITMAVHGFICLCVMTYNEQTGMVGTIFLTTLFLVYMGFCFGGTILKIKQNRYQSKKKTSSKIFGYVAAVVGYCVLGPLVASLSRDAVLMILVVCVFFLTGIFGYYSTHILTAYLMRLIDE